MDPLVRIRVLRRDGYTCREKAPRRGLCGAPASQVGVGASGLEIVALCHVHAHVRASGSEHA